MNIELLTAIYGQVSALHMLPVLHPNPPDWGGWMAAYRDSGLSFANARKDAEDLRVLTAGGMLTARGSTQGRGFRLTFTGALTAAAWGGHFVKDCQAAAVELQRAQGKTPYTLPDTDWPIVMGFQLIPAAGDWWANVSRDPAAYTLAMVRCLGLLTPMLACGFAELYPSRSGSFFALHIRSLPDDWNPAPDTPTNDAEAGATWQACCKGFDLGIARFQRSAPAAYSAIVPCMVPDSRWDAGTR